MNPAPLFILSGGEPLLRDDLAVLAQFATSRGATVVIGTNGTLLTDERIQELKAAGVTGVAVSIESLRPDYHDRFRRGHGSLEATLEAVERLRRHQLDFIVQTTLTKGNRDELPVLVAWAAEQGTQSRSPTLRRPPETQYYWPSSRGTQTVPTQAFATKRRLSTWHSKDSNNALLWVEICHTPRTRS